MLNFLFYKSSWLYGGLSAHFLFLVAFDVLPQHTVYILAETPLVRLGQSPQFFSNIHIKSDAYFFLQRSVLRFIQGHL